MSTHRIAFLVAAMALASCGAPVPPQAPAASEPAATAEPLAKAAPEVTASPAPVAAKAAPTPSHAALPSVEVVVGELPPAPKVVPVLAIVAPQKNQVVPAKAAASFAIKLSAKDFEPGPGGDHLCVVLDGRPCRRVDSIGAPLTLADLDPAIDEGQHVLSVLARRGSGELVRGSGKRAPFASRSFFVGKKVPPVWKEGAPMIFFSAPESGPAPAEGVLLDYYVANAEIAPGKYVVHASVGGPGIMDGVGLSLDSPRPLRLRNAQPGEYLARFSLFQFGHDLGDSRSHVTVTSTSKPVPGPFSEVTRGFRVEAAR